MRNFRCQRVGKFVFTQRAQQEMPSLQKGLNAEFSLPASGKIYFHATSAAENAKFYVVNAEIAHLVEHNLAPKRIRMIAFATCC